MPRSLRLLGLASGALIVAACASRRPPPGLCADDTQCSGDRRCLRLASDPSPPDPRYPYGKCVVPPDPRCEGMLSCGLTGPCFIDDLNCVGDAGRDQDAR